MLWSQWWKRETDGRRQQNRKTRWVKKKEGKKNKTAAAIHRRLIQDIHAKTKHNQFPKAPKLKQAQPQLNLISTIITHRKQKMKKWVPAVLAHRHDNLHYCICDQMSFPLWNKQSKSKKIFCFPSTQAVKSLSKHVLSPIPQKPDHT